MIGRLSTEHVAIINATGALRRVVLDGDGTEAATAVEELAALLDPHTRGEEQGLFAELRLDEDFADHVDALCAEHREIDARLARVADGDHSDVQELENLLRRHIDKEENGIFPAAAVALDGAAWTASRSGHRERPADRTEPCDGYSAGVTVSEQGGDPACWLSQVCPNCGRLNGRSADGCPSCATHTSGAAATEEDTR